MDMARAKVFAAEMMRRYGDAMVTMLVDVGDRTGLLAATAHGGTSEEIAEIAGLAERPVREWLRAMVVSGLAHHDPDGDRYSLPPEHAAILVGETPYNLAPLARATAGIVASTERIAGYFHDGAGIPVQEREDEISVLDRMSRARFDALLTEVYLPAAGEVHDRLREEGGRVADLGCGTGHSTNLMARALPDAEVLGYDVAAEAIARAEDEMAEMGLTNVGFREAEVEAVTDDGPFDLVTAFDVIHDLGDPGRALAAIRRSLRDDGVLLMYDPGAPDDLDAQAEVDWAPFMYGMSIGFCLPTGLAQGERALGSMAGRDATIALARDAGFAEVEVLEPPLDPINVLYVCRP